MSDYRTEDLGDQHERTLLAWRRTALSLVAAGALVGHLTARDTDPLVLAAGLAGIGAVVAFVWLSPGRRVAAAGVALVLGVVLLGGLALAGLVVDPR